LPKLTLEAHALGDLKARDDAPLDLLAGLSGSFARSPVFAAGFGSASGAGPIYSSCLQRGRLFPDAFAPLSQAFGSSCANSESFASHSLAPGRILCAAQASGMGAVLTIKSLKQ
jgi:hypothetical protein